MARNLFTNPGNQETIRAEIGDQKRPRSPYRIDQGTERKRYKYSLSPDTPPPDDSPRARRDSPVMSKDEWMSGASWLWDVLDRAQRGMKGLSVERESM
jgi:hypothetical protein